MKQTNVKSKTEKRMRRRVRIRSQISGTKATPRLAVYKSLRYIYAQLIDDENGVTLASASSLSVKKNGKKTDLAKKTGEDLAKLALEKGIKKVVFDRGGFIYTGRVKALAESARAAGLQF